MDTSLSRMANIVLNLQRLFETTNSCTPPHTRAKKN